jgi:outer membrane protein assembly factor BamE (lipoprotein component of BamABCDE complex)
MIRALLIINSLTGRRILKSIFSPGSSRLVAVAAVTLASLSLTACGITKVGDVPEYLDSSFDTAPPKDFLSQGDLSKIKVGMSPLEVRNRVGPAMLGDKEEKGRWDYVVRKGAGPNAEYLPYGVYFENDKVVKIAQLESNGAPKMAVDAAAPAAAPVATPDAAAAALPADPAPAAPAVGGDAVNEINDVLTGWANAWTAKDSAAYLGFYADTFEHGKKSRKAWEGERRKRLAAPDTITLNLTDVQITLQSDVLAEVSFKQAYTSNKYTDNGSKTLVLSKASGSWKIQKETFSK